MEGRKVERRRPDSDEAEEEAPPKPSEPAEDAMDTRSMKLMRRDMTILDLQELKPNEAIDEVAAKICDCKIARRGRRSKVMGVSL
jgi:hypothetical protein